MSGRRPQVSPVQRLVGGTLMAVGALIGGLSGLCTVVFATSITRLSDVSPALIFGGIPLLAGVGLFALGRRIFRG